eukprot:5803268-Prymnesium_polylepis.1
MALVRPHMALVLPRVCVQAQKQSWVNGVRSATLHIIFLVMLCAILGAVCGHIRGCVWPY